MVAGSPLGSFPFLLLTPFFSPYSRSLFWPPSKLYRLLATLFVWLCCSRGNLTLPSRHSLPLTYESYLDRPFGFVRRPAAIYWADPDTSLRQRTP
jgi:hypothetical protein